MSLSDTANHDAPAPNNPATETLGIGSEGQAKLQTGVSDDTKRYRISAWRWVLFLLVPWVLALAALSQIGTSGAAGCVVALLLFVLGPAWAYALYRETLIVSPRGLEFLSPLRNVVASWDSVEQVVTSRSIQGKWNDYLILRGNYQTSGVFKFRTDIPLGNWENQLQLGQQLRQYAPRLFIK